MTKLRARAVQEECRSGSATMYCGNCCWLVTKDEAACTRSTRGVQEWFRYNVLRTKLRARAVQEECRSGSATMYCGNCCWLVTKDEAACTRSTRGVQEWFRYNVLRTKLRARAVQEECRSGSATMYCGNCCWLVTKDEAACTRSTRGVQEWFRYNVLRLIVVGLLQRTKLRARAVQEECKSGSANDE
ncbi:hypothetical protein J6590_007662 [Homalodisca vitripennis]|nr:hypothetical protein J6590_007662 [Homalodisca vitripennis]